jgi:hypothetical protein
MGVGAVKESHGVLLTTDDDLQLLPARRIAFIATRSNCTRYGSHRAAKTAGKELALQ